MALSRIIEKDLTAGCKMIQLLSLQGEISYFISPKPLTYWSDISGFRLRGWVERMQLKERRSKGNTE